MATKPKHPARRLPVSPPVTAVDGLADALGIDRKLFRKAIKQHETAPNIAERELLEAYGGELLEAYGVCIALAGAFDRHVVNSPPVRFNAKMRACAINASNFLWRLAADLEVERGKLWTKPRVVRDLLPKSQQKLGRKHHAVKT